eukprot:GHVP01028146.1.p1 GENE.GHVP01028146.1~~GHVP01028146.1.p1  ORF type:complete len:170 (-),score=19.66 GHVP01028146.1:69-578(-)
MEITIFQCTKFEHYNGFHKFPNLAKNRKYSPEPQKSDLGLGLTFNTIVLPSTNWTSITVNFMHLPALNAKHVNSTVAHDLTVKSDLKESLLCKFHFVFTENDFEAEKFLNEIFHPSFLSGVSDKDMQESAKKCFPCRSSGIYTFHGSRCSIFPEKEQVLALKVSNLMSK